MSSSTHRSTNNALVSQTSLFTAPFSTLSGPLKDSAEALVLSMCWKHGTGMCDHLLEISSGHACPCAKIQLVCCTCILPSPVMDCHVIYGIAAILRTGQKVPFFCWKVQWGIHLSHHFHVLYYPANVLCLWPCIMDFQPTLIPVWSPMQYCCWHSEIAFV